MKVGDIIKINGKLQKVVINKQGCFLKANCPLYDKCPEKNSNCTCLQPVFLEYGKWYPCSQVMPEDFEELIEVLPDYRGKQHCMMSSIIVRQVDSYMIPFNVITKRIGINSQFEWVNKNHEITHWLAIPPLNK